MTSKVYVERSSSLDMSWHWWVRSHPPERSGSSSGSDPGSSSGSSPRNDEGWHPGRVSPRKRAHRASPRKVRGTPRNDGHQRVAPSSVSAGHKGDAAQQGRSERRVENVRNVEAGGSSPLTSTRCCITTFSWSTGTCDVPSLGHLECLTRTAAA